MERCGFGVIRSDGQVLVAEDYGLIATPRGLPAGERLLRLYEAMCEKLAAMRPDLVVVERLFFSRNRTSALSVGEARGVLLLAVTQQGTALREYTPAEVKQAVCGYGNADKDQVGTMVRMVLRLLETPRPDDVADALAVAICGINAARMEALLP